MDTSNIRANLRTFIGGFVKNKAFADSENIFAAGYVNSLFVMQLLLHIEKKYAIEVENEEMDLKNFNSIDSLTHFIEGKLCIKSTP